MAQEQKENPAKAGTEQAPGAASATPVWDRFDGEMYPFLNLNEEQKRAGFRVTFLADKPRRETVNRIKPELTDFWFDVLHEGEEYTWTISQISLVLELQKHRPLKDKTFDIQLVPVDAEFKKQFANFKGKDRYVVKPVESGDTEPSVEEESVKE